MIWKEWSSTKMNMKIYTVRRDHARCGLIRVINNHFVWDRKNGKRENVLPISSGARKNKSRLKILCNCLNRIALFTSKHKYKHMTADKLELLAAISNKCFIRVDRKLDLNNFRYLHTAGTVAFTSSIHGMQYIFRQLKNHKLKN